MSTETWNHNIHYHGLVLRSAPLGCRCALDVGCGTGLLARKLARRCDEVVAIDFDRQTLARARAANNSEARITFVEGDVMTHRFSDDSFDLITVVATLHNLPLRPALARFRNLLRSGGILAVIGLYREQTLADYGFALAVAVPANWILRWLNRHRHADVGAPLKDPRETLREIRNAFDSQLPGGAFQRRVLFRYSFVWRKP